jgi:hypothetical protein
MRGLSLLVASASRLPIVHLLNAYLENFSMDASPAAE